MDTPSLTIRAATEHDSKDLFEWRNDPQTRAVSLSTDEVAWEDHERWFATSMQNPERLIYICESELDGQRMPVGMVRFDIHEVSEESGSSPEAEVSINVNPIARRRGFGVVALMSGINQFARDQPTVGRLTAQIRDSNHPSVSIFTTAGFELDHSEGGVGRFVRKS